MRIQGWLTGLFSFLAILPQSAVAVECNGSRVGVSVAAKATSASRGQTVFSRSHSSMNMPMAECEYQESYGPAVEVGTKFAIACERFKRNGKRVVSAEATWEASLAGVRLNLIRGSLFAEEYWPTQVLLTQSVMGNISVTAQFQSLENRGYVFYSGFDLLPNAEQKWDVEWAISTDKSARKGHTVRCQIRQL